jgi:glycosyltransferase involved in cell wall biosynthesis
MNILLVSSPSIRVPPWLYGGTERIVYYLILGLMELGHTVTLLAPGDSDVPCSLVPICPSELVYQQNQQDEDRFIKLRQEAEKVALEYIRQHHHLYDVVHGHGIDLSSVCYLIPCVTTLHGPINSGNYALYSRRVNQNLVSISYDQAQSYKTFTQENRLDGPNIHCIATVYNGLMVSEFPLVTEPEGKYLLWGGRYDGEKCPHLAIELALALDYPIVLFGKEDFSGQAYREQYLYKYRDKTKYPTVTFLGELGAEKLTLMANATALMHPNSSREPFGLMVVEAAYCGTPVIARRRGSMGEVILPGINGFAVDADNYVQEGLEVFPKLLKLDRKVVAQTTREKFNHLKMAEGYVEVYHQIM